MKIRSVIFGAIIIYLIHGCGVSSKAQLEALAKCKYDVESLEDMQIVGMPVQSLLDGQGGLKTNALPAVALAVLRKDVPLKGRIKLKITNPTKGRAALNQFRYLVEIQGKQLFEGTVDENIRLDPDESAYVPLSFSTNLFDLTNDNDIKRMFEELFSSDKGALLTLKIKPSVKIGNKNVYYPGYISIDKNISRKLLL